MNSPKVCCVFHSWKREFLMESEHQDRFIFLRHSAFGIKRREDKGLQIRVRWGNGLEVALLGLISIRPGSSDEATLCWFS